MDVEYFPFDEQTCVMKFGSWTYEGFQVVKMAITLIVLMTILAAMVMKLSTRWTYATRMPESHKCIAMFGPSRKRKGSEYLSLICFTSKLAEGMSCNQDYHSRLYLLFLGPRDRGDGHRPQRVLQVGRVGHPGCSCSQVL